MRNFTTETKKAPTSRLARVTAHAANRRTVVFNTKPAKSENPNAGLRPVHALVRETDLSDRPRWIGTTYLAKATGPADGTGC